MTQAIRADLAEAHGDGWAWLASAGTWWSAREKRELADTAIRAMWGDGVGGAVHENLAHRAIAQIAVGNSHLTREWYDGVAAEIGALPYVELVGIACVAAAITSLRNSLGLPHVELPDASEEPPSRIDSPELADAELNWVPVAAPADETAAVVQALTAVPDANAALWRLADVQYIPDAEMVDPRWTRGTLSRVEMELIATRVSFSRECHY